VKIKCFYCNGKGFVIKPKSSTHKIYLRKTINFIGGKDVNPDWKDEVGKYIIMEKKYYQFFEFENIMEFIVPCQLGYDTGFCNSLEEIIITLESKRPVNPFNVQAIEMMIKKIKKGEQK